MPHLDAPGPTPAELATAHRHLVYTIATLKLRRGRLGDDWDELVGDGMLGLVEAARRYKARPGGVKFATYADKRIRGAMIDGFRRRRGISGQYHNHWPTLPCSIDTPRPGQAYGTVVDDLVSPFRITEDDIVARLDLQKALERMNPRLRLVALAMLADEPWQAVATQLGVGESRLSRMRNEVRTQLEFLRAA